MRTIKTNKNGLHVIDTNSEESIQYYTDNERNATKTKLHNVNGNYYFYVGGMKYHLDDFDTV
ncbi:hypothetical protein UFOVP451_35 [uncultured Caudovirales phage]|uniref:Uncharacterized protein n=1 Tax=uncultured Caudovirales phage TaxID=2100421 RepID=A0A6J5M7H3_9CAUD|nr:hypothetical protein UFOVP451_35 [uncultured Caudovirales phage]